MKSKTCQKRGKRKKTNASDAKKFNVPLTMWIACENVETTSACFTFFDLVFGTMKKKRILALSLTAEILNMPSHWMRENKQMENIMAE